MEFPGRLPIGVTRILTEDGATDKQWQATTIGIPSTAPSIVIVLTLWDTDWSEPWILTLVFFHVVCLFFTYLSFRHYRFQIGLFLCLIILVFCAEYINEAAAANWRFFSKHQYFDSQGMFISLVFSVPLLLNAILIVIAWVYKTVNVMTELKTIQQKRKARREEKKSQ